MTTHATRVSSDKLYPRIGAMLGVKSIRSDKDLIEYVESRLSLCTISSLIKNGLTENEVYSLIIPRRTLSHRKSNRDALNRDESDRAVRIARILALAEGVFGNHEKALRWLRKPKRRFENRSPLELLVTDVGSRAVEELLYQIDYGMAA